VYLSWDIDGLDPDAVSEHRHARARGPLVTPRPCTSCARSWRAVAASWGSISSRSRPGANDGDEWDANVGARLLYKMIGFALRSRGRL
jgi:agmatinase